MMGFLWCGGNRKGALPSGRDSTFVSELPGGTRRQLLEIREVLFPEFQRTALICGDLRGFGAPQIDAADLAGDGLGQFGELDPPHPLEGRQMRAGMAEEREGRGAVGGLAGG